jgi:hypothetical protein
MCLYLCVCVVCVCRGGVQGAHPVLTKPNLACPSARRAQVRVTTTSFQDAFDDDDDLVYNPIYTGALVLSESRPPAASGPREC